MRQYSQYTKQNMPFAVAVAAGKVPGWRSYRKFGMNPSVASGTEYMWPPGTEQVLDNTAYVASVVSSSAEDDPDEATPPGTGAWTLTIEGLDANFDEVSETVTLTGLTPAVTTQTFARMHRMYVVTAGSNGTNVGNLTLTLNGNTQAWIEANEGQTHQTMFTVPRGHTLIVNHYLHGTGRIPSGATAIQGQIRLNGGQSDESWRTLSDVFNYQNHFISTDTIFYIPEMTDTRIRVVSTASTNAYAEYSGFLVENDYL